MLSGLRAGPSLRRTPAAVRWSRVSLHLCYWNRRDMLAIMARTESNMLALGTRAPDFRLPDVTTGNMVSVDDFRDKKAMLVMFICRHCPYVRHVQSELAKIGRDYADRSLAIVAISSND